MKMHWKLNSKAGCFSNNYYYLLHVSVTVCFLLDSAQVAWNIKMVHATNESQNPDLNFCFGGQKCTSWFRENVLKYIKKIKLMIKFSETVIWKDVEIWQREVQGPGVSACTCWLLAAFCHFRWQCRARFYLVQWHQHPIVCLLFKYTQACWNKLIFVGFEMHSCQHS